MKTKSTVLILLFLFAFSSFAFAAEPPAEMTQSPPDPNKAIVAVLFANNAKTNFDAEINKKMMTNFDTLTLPKQKIKW